MKYNVENIPAELHNLKQWLCWKKFPKDNGKTTKVPMNAMTGRNASVTNPDDWTDVWGAIEGAVKYGFDGIGFVLEGEYFGVDLDECEDDLKKEFIEQLHSYTEISQSGKGIHIICKGNIEKSSRTKGIEIYKGARYFVMTGDVIGDYEINDCTESIKPLYEKYFGSRTEKVPSQTQLIVSEPIKLTDDEVISKAQNSRNGDQFRMLMAGRWEELNYPSQSEADMALATILSFWTAKNGEQIDRLFRMSGLYRDKWDSKRGSSTYGLQTIENAILKTANVYNSSFVNDSNILINAHTGEVVVKKQESYELNDTGNSKRFSDKYSGYVKYNIENKKWVLWNGKFWQVDDLNRIKTYAELIIQEMKAEANMEYDENARKNMNRNVQRAFQSAGKEAMLKEAQHIDDIPVRNSDFDKQDFLINTESGVVDLKTGTISEHNREYLMSKMIPYEVDMTSEPKQWLKFLHEIFLGDEDLIAFIQKAVGYTLTGSISEQSLFMAYGDGSNGKSVFLDIIAKMMGDYAKNAQVETLLERKYGTSNYSSDLARLNGARFITTGENNEGSKINEGLIKQLTGGEKITARYLYGAEFEFYPNFKLWIATNHKPIIRGSDNGIWRRIISIPFMYKVEASKRDKNLISKLEKEMPSILGWAIKGCLLWQKEGLKLPAVIEESNKTYQKEMDIIQTFLDENCEIDQSYSTSAKELYEEYEQWARTSNEYVMSGTRFGRELAKRFEKTRKATGNAYVGVALRKNVMGYVYQKTR